MPQTQFHKKKFTGELALASTCQYKRKVTRNIRNFPSDITSEYQVLTMLVGSTSPPAPIPTAAGQSLTPPPSCLTGHPPPARGVGAGRASCFTGQPPAAGAADAGLAWNSLHWPSSGQPSCFGFEGSEVADCADVAAPIIRESSVRCANNNQIKTISFT